jgi:flavin reductase (DIM6/NTAB) family NADH-FMN oxidoreductase RutF
MRSTMLMPASQMPPAAALDPLALRRALGHFATGICVVTTLDASGRPQGLTINSFASVSLAPPLVLWCLDRASQSAAAFRGAARFNIGVLHAGQEAVSRRFSSRLPDRFDGSEDWIGRDAHGLPVVRGALALFACRCTQQVEAGDHLIMIGEVEGFEAADAASARPLLYHGGRYRGLAAPPA